MKDLAPSDQVTTSLRFALREVTRDAHERLDQGISALDLRTRDGFVRFCQCHIASFRALAPRSGDPAMRDQLCGFVARLEDDLATLGQPESRGNTGCGPVFDDLSVAYIVHGSRLGTKVLRRTWAESDDPLVRQASAYMSGDIDGLAWRETCASLDALDPLATRGRTIANEALEIFALFQRSLDRGEAPTAERRHERHDGHVNHS